MGGGGGGFSGGSGSMGGGGGGPPGGPPGGSSNHFGQNDGNRDRSGKWALYDEKVHINNKLMYDPKKPATWLQDARDYVAGRTQEIDALIQWIELQDEEIDHEHARRTFPGCMDCAPMAEISRQMWSYLGPLVKGDDEKASIFNNVPRHNGLEA